MRIVRIIVVAVIASAMWACGGGIESREVNEEGTILLYFLQRPVGEETYALRSTENGDLDFSAKFLYTERTSTVALDATLRMAADYTPKRFSIKGKSYRWSSVDAQVEVAGTTAQVTDRGQRSSVTVPQKFFTISGYSPLSAQAMLIRYWKEHGEPPRISTLPAGADNTNEAVEISYAGRDRLRIDNQDVSLDRYTVNNVVWGRESVWLDTDGRFAAATTLTGGLPLDAVRKEYASALPQFISLAVADRVSDLQTLSRSIPPVQSGSFAIVGATIITGTSAAPIQNAVAVVRDGRIVAVGNQGQVEVPADIPTFDARGKTLLPGLWDMHAHFTHIEWGPAYLAAGVTMARDCGGAFEFSTAIRAELDQGRSLGPRLILAPFVDGPGASSLGTTIASNEEEARAIVEKFHAAGIEQVKIYGGVTPEVLRVLTREAHKVGMTVTGHIPSGMNALEAVQAGMDQLNHIGGIVSVMRDNPARAISVFKKHQTVIDPTLAWGELIGQAVDVPRASFEPGIEKTPYQLASLINTAGAPPSERAAVNARQAEQLKVVLQLHRAGIPIVAGTDKGVPGHSLHRELELYVQAGLTPLEAIQTATINPARAMKLEHEVGTVEAGKRADMILIDGNPLDDIRNIRNVSHVIINGRLHETAPLWRSVGFKP